VNEFVVLVQAGSRDGAGAGRLGERTGRYAAWLSSLRSRGILRGGGPVGDGAVSVRSAGGRAVVEPAAGDGRVTSYLVVAADDLPSAIALATSCPEFTGGVVTVLPVS